MTDDSAPNDEDPTFIAEYPEGDRVSTFDFKVYGRAGLAREEAVAWAASGVRPYQAEGFRAAGFGLDEAVVATQMGMPGIFARRCHERGGNPWEEWSAEREAKDRAARAQAEQAAEIDAEARRRLGELSRLPGLYTLSVGDIADLLGVADSQVSRWSKGSGFPVGVDAFGRPRAATAADAKADRGERSRYRVDEVATWIATLGREPDSILRTVTPAWRWGVVVRSLPDDPTTLPLVAAELCGVRDDETRAWAEALDAHPHADDVHTTRSADLRTRVRDAISHDLDPAVMLDDACDALATRDNSTSHALIEQVADACTGFDLDGGILYDPAVGYGDLLVTVARRVGHDGPIRGRDQNPLAVRVARARFELRGLDAEITGSNSLTDGAPEEKARLVVSDLPSSRSTKDMRRWLDHVLASVSDEGRAVVTLPADPDLLAPAVTRLERCIVLPSKVKPDSRGDVVVAVFNATGSPTVALVNLRHADIATAKRLTNPSRRRSPKAPEHVVRAAPDSEHSMPPDSSKDWLHAREITWTVPNEEFVDRIWDVVAGGRTSSTEPDPHAAALARKLLSLLGTDPADRELRKAIEDRFGTRTDG